MTLRGDWLTQAVLDEPIVCVLLGRDRQLHALQTLAEEAATGGGHTVLVSGEAGIGKSRLVNELAVSLERDGWAVVRGSCFERDRTVPYAPVAEMLRQVVDPRRGLACAWEPQGSPPAHTVSNSSASGQSYLRESCRN
jgi:hypothetical protein